MLYVILSIVEESPHYTASVGKGGHVGNKILIRSINMPNVIESSKTKMLLKYIF